MGQGLFFFKQRPYTESVTFPIRVGTNIVDSRCKIVKIKNDHNMKRRYQIEGMTCDGCRGHVEEALFNVAGVADVAVNLKNAEATVESQFEVPLENLQKALENNGGQYKIQAMSKAN